MLQGGELVLGWPGGFLEIKSGGRAKRREETALCRGSQIREAAPQGTSVLRVPGKQEDNFPRTKGKENWILQPLTLLLGPL